MRRLGCAVLRWLPPFLCVVLLCATVYAVSPSVWCALGEETALLMIGVKEQEETALQVYQDMLPHVATPQPTLPSVDVQTAVPTISEPIIPPKGDGGGAVSEEQVGGGVQYGKLFVKNNSGVTYDFAALTAAGMPFDLPESNQPQVLIVHTHTTECYMSYYAGYYNDDDVTRTTDPSQNVVAVGEAIAGELSAKGIGVLHDETLHDSPQYTGAYNRSEETILRYLEQYPSIRVVLDIHRDAMMYEDLTKVKPTVTVEGQKAAQVMLVVGGTDTAELPNAHCEENLRFALQLQQALESRYEGLARPMYVVDARYNQGLLAGSLLIEVGTDANTLSEALYSGRLVGKELAAVLS